MSKPRSGRRRGSALLCDFLKRALNAARDQAGASVGAQPPWGACSPAPTPWCETPGSTFLSLWPARHLPHREPPPPAPHQTRPIQDRRPAGSPSPSRQASPSGVALRGGGVRPHTWCQQDPTAMGPDRRGTERLANWGEHRGAQANAQHPRTGLGNRSPSWIISHLWLGDP